MADTWKAYIQDHLLSSGKVQKAAIISHQGGKAWANSTGYEVSATEHKAIMAAFNNPADIQAHGIHLAGQKFFVLRCDPERIYGKNGSTSGCVIIKTTKAVLVTEYLSPIQAPEATPVVESFADYLKSNQL